MADLEDLLKKFGLVAKLWKALAETLRVFGEDQEPEQKALALKGLYENIQLAKVMLAEDEPLPEFRDSLRDAYEECKKELIKGEEHLLLHYSDNAEVMALLESFGKPKS